MNQELMDLAYEIEQRFFHTSLGVVSPCPRFCSQCEHTRRIANWLRVKAGGEPVKKIEVIGMVPWTGDNGDNDGDEW